MHTMRSLTAGVQDAYTRIAPVYEQHTSGPLAPPLQHYAQAMVTQLGSRAHLLDIGCGTGHHMGWFERAGVQVTGIDLTAAMLKRARSHTTGQLIQAMMHHLPFAAARFDGAWCCASLLHIPKAELLTVLHEVRRVVRLHGLIMISMQEGTGEQWDGGYVEGVTRFFARYQQEELHTIITASGLAIHDYAVERSGQRSWITTLCQVQSATERCD